MTIVYVLVAFLVGWVIGFFDSNMRTAKKIKAAEAKAELALAEAEKKVADAQAHMKAGTQVVADDPGLLRIKKVNNVPSLEVDGKPLNVNQVSADQKKRLIELLSLIRPWVESAKSPPPASMPAAPVSARPEPAPAQPAASSIAPLPVQPLPIVKPVDEKNILSLSIVAQIDTVLQARLMNTPLAGKGIRLAESSIGGVEVYVGLQKYSSVDDVPDEGIKTAIRAAIAEWEKKFTPGV